MLGKVVKEVYRKTMDQVGAQLMCLHRYIPNNCAISILCNYSHPHHRLCVQRKPPGHYLKVLFAFPPHGKELYNYMK